LGDACAPLVVLQDDGYDTVGGDVVFQRLLDRLGTRDDGERGGDVCIVCVENPPVVYTEYNRLYSVIDCFTNPCGVLNGGHAWLGEDTLEKLEQDVYGNVPHGGGVVGIDGVSSFVEHYGSRAVAHFLSRIRRHPSVGCVLIHVHADMHEKSRHDLAMVSQDALCLVKLMPGWGLAVDQSHPGDSLGKLILCMRKSQGCKKTDVYEYWMDGEEGLRIESVKERHKAGGMASEAAPVTSVLQQMQSNMKLELTEEEKRAKTSVVLPYEHQGHHDAYQTNDYRDYLPPEAGGHAGHLGHILYVRDSDSDGDFDSDEDPDDDLDI